MPLQDLDWRAAPDWYDANAAAFEAGSLELDTQAIIARFIRGLPAGGRILDLGCGVGRDTRAFLDLGFEVEAVDPSGEMCEATLRNTGGRCDVRMALIQDMPPMAEHWDGIWMMASLLHVPHTDWPRVLADLTASLRRGGRIYASVKTGSGEAVDARGRPMSYASTEELISALTSACARPARAVGWTSTSIASNGEETTWANAILTVS